MTPTTPPTPTAAHVPWRDLDFRFLLPVARLGRVHAPGTLHERLREAGAEPVLADGPIIIKGNVEGNIFPRSGEPALETTFWRGGRALPASIRRRDDARTYWTRGEAGAPPVSWVPLWDAAAAHYLRRQTGGSSLRERVLRGVTATGVLPWAVSRTAVLAGPEHRPLVEQHLTSLEPEVVSSVLLTPTFPTSRHVVLLGLDRSGVVRGVGKFARRPGDTTQLRQEAVTLRLLAAHGAGHLAPELWGEVTTCGSDGIICAGVQGRSLGALSDRDEVAALASGFCAELPVTARADDAAYLPAVQTSLTLLAEAFPEHQVTLARTRDAADRLRDRPVVGVLEHGDVAHHNLLVAEDGQVRAIDWENGLEAGLPGHDLALALEYATSLEVAEGADPARVRAYLSAMSEHGWARAVWAEHLIHRGVGPARHADLLLVSWGRRAAAALRRSDDRAVAAHHRDVQIWQELSR